MATYHFKYGIDYVVVNSKADDRLDLCGTTLLSGLVMHVIVATSCATKVCNRSLICHHPKQLSVLAKSCETNDELTLFSNVLHLWLLFKDSS